MILRPLLAACLALGPFVLPAEAGEIKQNPKTVVELFTSQGCSNCPPADALLEELAQKPDVIALGYHVDYWDYKGWSDTFGRGEHSDRQRDYAGAWGSSRIFTPQMVVNGANGVVGSRRDEVGGAMAAATLRLKVTLETKNGDMLKVTIPPDPALGEATVWLVTYIERAEVAIARGENEGKTIGYTQIVTGRQVLGMWEPASGAKLKLPLGELLTAPANGVAILVQQEQGGLPGPILGAASYSR